MCILSKLCDVSLRSCVKRVSEKDDTLMNKLAVFFVSKVNMTTANMVYNQFIFFAEN